MHSTLLAKLYTAGYVLLFAVSTCVSVFINWSNYKALATRITKAFFLKSERL
jgi:hypothetical protein